MQPLESTFSFLSLSGLVNCRRFLYPLSHFLNEYEVRPVLKIDDDSTSKDEYAPFNSMCLDIVCLHLLEWRPLALSNASLRWLNVNEESLKQGKVIS